MVSCLQCRVCSLSPGFGEFLVSSIWQSSIHSVADALVSKVKQTSPGDLRVFQIPDRPDSVSPLSSWRGGHQGSQNHRAPVVLTVWSFRAFTGCHCHQPFVATRSFQLASLNKQTRVGAVGPRPRRPLVANRGGSSPFRSSLSSPHHP